MELVTRKSECKRHTDDAALLIKSPRQITKSRTQNGAPKYCIIVKPFHASFLPYKQIVFRGVTFSDDFSIELIRNNEAVVIEKEEAREHFAHLFHANSDATFRIMP